MRMNYAVATLAVLLVACGGATLAASQMDSPGAGRSAAANPFADPAPPGTADALHAGVGVICNTRQQAEHFVRLRADGIRIPAAMNSVNAQSHDPKACGMAAVAYTRGKTMDTRNLNGRTVDIVRIGVVAGYDGRGWTRMPQHMTQYAVIRSKGILV